MSLCDACGKEPGVFHVTASLQLAGPAGTRRKMVQFWLGERCEKANQQVMEAGPNLKSRIARRFTEWPEYLSRWKDWRRRVHPDYQEAQA